MKVTLLGPQHALPSVGRVLASLGVRGPVAVVTAGWQERESDPGIIPELDLPAVNLTVHTRADAVFAKDAELAEAYKQRQTRLRLMQEFYRVRLDHANQAATAISLRHVDAALLADERTVSVELVRGLDRDHLERCAAIQTAFDARWAATHRPSVAAHRRELAALIEPTDAVVIAGGHVAVLLNRIRMFDLIGLCGARPIIAWSAGAMTLCDQVVLFHDDPPNVVPVAEVLDAGLGLVPAVVALPNPRLRLRLDDADRVAMYARRFAPAACIAMDHGARIDAVDGRVVGGAGNQRLRVDGTVERGWP